MECEPCFLWAADRGEADKPFLSSLELSIQRDASLIVAAVDSKRRPFFTNSVQDIFPIGQVQLTRVGAY